MRRVVSALLLLVGLVPAPLHAAPVPMYASFDAATDLAGSYVGARYYVPRTGRFTSEDPAMNVSAALLNPQRWNRYAYAGNNPVRFVDPDGRDFWDKMTGAANAIASNFGFAPRLGGGNEDFRNGQTAGDVVSVLIGAAESVAGGAIVGGGSASAATVVGAPIGIPVVAAGVAILAHGAAGSINGVVHMSSANGGGHFGGLTKATGRELTGIDVHAANETLVGGKISKDNISIDKTTGEVVLTPVRKGDGDPVRTGMTLDQLKGEFPKK